MKRRLTFLLHPQSCHQQGSVLRDAGFSEEEGFDPEGPLEAPARPGHAANWTCCQGTSQTSSGPDVPHLQREEAPAAVSGARQNNRFNPVQLKTGLFPC